jgi:hypothetical protein
MDLDPELDLKPYRKSSKMSSLIVMTLKIRESNISFVKYALKSHKKVHTIIGLVKEGWIRNFFASQIGFGSKTQKKTGSE